MREISFLTGELFFSAAYLAVRIILSIHRGRVDWKREAWMLLMYFNLAILVRITFFPFFMVNGQVQPLPFDPKAVFPLRVNLIPFVHMFIFDSRGDMLLNLLGNPAMFIPTGVLLPVLLRNLNSFPKVVGGGAFISLCIEILQLPFADRASDIDDIILNTIGAVIGYGIYAGVRRIARGRKVWTGNAVRI